MDSINLPPELAAIAFSEFGETKELRDTLLDQLRQRIQALPYVTDRLVDLSDRSLIRFLRSRKFDLETALESTIKLQQFAEKYQDVIKSLNNEEIGDFSHFLSVIREPLPSGRVIMMMKPKEGLKIFTEEKKRKNPRLMLKVDLFLEYSLYSFYIIDKYLDYSVEEQLH